VVALAIRLANFSVCLLIALSGCMSTNYRFAQAMSFVQIRSGLYVDALSVSVCALELYVGVHSCAPRLVSRLVAAPRFEDLPLSTILMVIFTLKG
jgi:hypothetical protein